MVRPQAGGPLHHDPDEQILASPCRKIVSSSRVRAALLYNTATVIPAVDLERRATKVPPFKDCRHGDVEMAPGTAFLTVGWCTTYAGGNLDHVTSELRLRQRFLVLQDVPVDLSQGGQGKKRETGRDERGGHGPAGFFLCIGWSAPSACIDASILSWRSSLAALAMEFITSATGVTRGDLGDPRTPAPCTTNPPNPFPRESKVIVIVQS